ncbi:hypothetical protein HT031_006273 [Scenedesmus sp. PABB004]|nr:hypothetical protein HT031_006273 [Scenedesmus sp. PABB004]
MENGGGASAAPPQPPPPPSVAQCRVLQTVIRLLEHHDDARKMLPLASMAPEMLQTTLASSQQPVHIADVLTKLAPHLEPATAAELWRQFRAGAPGGGGSAPADQSAPLAPGAPNPAHARLRRQAFAANAAACGACGQAHHASFSPLLLCDFCPRAQHVSCLGLDWADLPEGEWACPSCLPLPGGPRGSGRQDAERGARGAPDDISMELPRLQGAARSVDDAVDLQQGLPPLPPGGRRGGVAAAPYAAYGGGAFVAHAGGQLLQTADRRLQATAAGPPPLQDVIRDERQLRSLMDALAVAEFLATFAPVCGAPHLNLGQLQQAAAWPLDGPELFELYSSLVKYLLAQWSHIESGHVGARVKRWARCLERSSAVAARGAAAQRPEWCGPHNGLPPNGNATWQELLRRYCLLSRSSLRVRESELARGDACASLSDDLVMVHAAVELGKRAVWSLPPELHLRLLHALCNDVVNCFNMKTEIGGRLDATISQSTRQYHANAEERRREREAARARKEAAQAARDKRTRELLASAAATPGPGDSGGLSGACEGGGEGSGGEPPLKRARSGSAIGGDACELADGAHGFSARDDTPDPSSAADGWHGGGGGGSSAWRGAEGCEALAADPARQAIRSEPLGTDRHHQRYWHMQSDPSVIFVESAGGDSLGLITSRVQLDALLAALNKRGSREGALHQALHRRRDEFTRCLRPPELPLDVRSVPRGRRQRAAWLRRAAAAMPACAEATAVAACLSELEALVSTLVGAGVYELPVKHWRARLRGKTSVDELCQVLEELEAALSRVGDGRPPGATEELLDEAVREADAYEAEFVMPVSAAELAEQQEAAAAAAAAAAAEKAAAGEGGDGADGADGAEGGEEGGAGAAKGAPAPPAAPTGRGGGRSKGKGGSGKGGSKSKGKGGDSLRAAGHRPPPPALLAHAGGSGRGGG